VQLRETNGEGEKIGTERNACKQKQKGEYYLSLDDEGRSRGGWREKKQLFMSTFFADCKEIKHKEKGGGRGSRGLSI